MHRMLVIFRQIALILIFQRLSYEGVRWNQEGKPEVSNTSQGMFGHHPEDLGAIWLVSISIL